MRTTITDDERATVLASLSSQERVQFDALAADVQEEILNDKLVLMHLTAFFALLGEGQDIYNRIPPQVNRALHEGFAEFTRLVVNVRLTVERATQAPIAGLPGGFIAQAQARHAALLAPPRVELPPVEPSAPDQPV